MICVVETRIEILGDMIEDERQNLLETVAEDQGGLSEVASKLRRELTPKAPVLKAAIKAECEIFRLKRKLQRLDVEDLEQAKRTSLPEVLREGEGGRRGPATAANP